MNENKSIEKSNAVAESEKVDFKAIADKWQAKWEEANLGVVERDSSKKKFFMIWAYATVSGFQHTGHMRGYSYTDAICRYKRMRGFNVLMPAGGHATGNGAIAKAQKIKEKDPSWIKEFKSRGLSDKEIEKISDHDSFVEFFSKSYIEDYKAFGFIGDWRRFTVTTHPDYNKFIEWQFHKLNEKNLLIQKPYFATACIKCGPVAVDPSEMDLSKGGNAEVNEYVLIKLRFEKDNQFIMCATLRPETMYGQTNIWIDPEISYVKARVGDEVWIVSKEAAEKIMYQKEDVKIIGEIQAKDMLGKLCRAPKVNKDVIILPSKFCDPDIGTGIVTSVPSDAPHDWMGLKDLQESEDECRKHGLDYEAVKAIKLIPIIKTPGFGDYPAVEICDKLGIKSQDDEEKLEKAKKEIYKLGFHAGVMNDNCGEYSGQKVTVAKDIIKDDLLTAGDADIMQDLSEEVICRCGSPVVIKKVEGQWFIKYSDEKLTEQTKKHALSMDIFPDNYYENIEETLDWFQDRPCARQGRWLGTTFPFDKSYIIEAISDSTLYPIFYLISKYVNEGEISVENLNLEFFDYVFLSKGDVVSVSKSSGVNEKLLNQIKEDVLYWYPLDINLGGKEHRRVHFPPFLMNHVAILPKELWPKGIFVNEWVMQSKDQKLSKSKGGAQPIPDVAESYSVDAMRLYYANIASPFVDIYFNESDILNYKTRLEKIYYLFKDSSSISGSNLTSADTLLLSKFNRRIKQATDFMESYDFKRTTDVVYVEMVRDINNYFKMGGKNKDTILNVLKGLAKCMSLFTPHIAEECYSFIEKNLLVSSESWPEFDESKIDVKAEIAEDILQTILSDIRSVKELAKIDRPKQVTLFASLPWKYDFYSVMKEQLSKTKDFKGIIGVVMKNPDFKKQGKEITKLIPVLIKKGLPKFLDSQDDEFSFINEHLLRIKKEVGCKVELIKAQDSKEPKAKNASPSKPAIVLE